MSDESDAGGKKNCTWENVPYKHGEERCDPQTNTINRCENGTWVDTGTPCDVGGGDQAGGRTASFSSGSPTSMTQSRGPWPGRFVWHDIMTTDAKKSQQFYCSLFDWQIQEMPLMGTTYRMIMCGPGPIGSIMEDKNIPKSHWMPYVGVDDVDATAAKIKKLGGSVCVPPTDIPDTGRFAVVGDPQGAFFSLYKGLPESEGFDPDLPVPGRACWNELYTSDDKAAQKFYSAVFGWKADTKNVGEGMTYHVQKLAGKEAGGMMKQPMPGMPSMWIVYFLVEELQAATAKAKELGANAMMEEIPIPDVGKFSMLMDPVGAMFTLFEASPELGKKG